VIADVGEGGDRALVSRRVLIDPAEFGPDGGIVGVLGSESDGGFAEFVVADQKRCHDVTASPLSDLQLAALPIAKVFTLDDIHAGQAVIRSSTAVGKVVIDV